MYVFALIGMQFFATKFRFDADGNPVEWLPHVYNYTVPPHAPWTPERPYTISRSNFDDTLSAFTTVFQCLTEESWNFVMYDGIRSAGWSALGYFLAVMVIGNIIILNLFLAILLGNFSLDEQQTEVEVAMLKGQQKIIDSIARSSIRKLSAVIPFGPNSSERRKSASALPGDHPPLSRQDTPTKRGHRIRRRSNQMNSLNSSRNLFDLGEAVDEPLPLQPLSPALRVGTSTPDITFHSRPPSFRRLPSMPKVLEAESHDGAERNGSAVPGIPHQQSRVVRLSRARSQPRLDVRLGPQAVPPSLPVSNESFPPPLKSMSSKSKLSQASDAKDTDVASAKSRPPSTLLSYSSRSSITQTTGDRKESERATVFRPPTSQLSALSLGALSAPQPASPRAARRPGSQALAYNAFSSSKLSRVVSDKSVSSRNGDVSVHDLDRSLLVFKRSGTVRRLCREISRHAYFELLILATILVGSILLAIDNPLNDPSSIQSVALGMMDNVFTAIFFVEMALKVVDKGFVFNGARSYLRDPWNALDFTILSFSGAMLISSSKTLRSLRSFRTLRALVSGAAK